MAHLLTGADEEKVRERIAQVERRTAGELLVIVSQQSSGYDRARALASAVVTFALAVLAYLMLPRVPGLWVLCAQAPVFVVLYWLTGRPALLRLLVPDEEQRRKVQARAHQLFLEQGATETRDRSGVLLYLSELEHRIEVVADRGIHERVGAECWKRVVEDVVSGIRRGTPVAGVLAAIDDIGVVLAEHFPPRPDDQNELPDQVVRV